MKFQLMGVLIAGVLCVSLAPAVSCGGIIYSEDFESAAASADYSAPDWVGNETVPQFVETESGGDHLMTDKVDNWVNRTPEMGNVFAVMYSHQVRTVDLTEASAANVFAANTTYTMTFLHAYRKGLAGAGVIADIEVAGGGATLATETFAAVSSPDGFVTRTVTYTTGATGAEIGQPIGLSVEYNNSVSGQIVLDNFTMETTPIPEPSTWLMLAAAACLLGSLRRHRGQFLQPGL